MDELEALMILSGAPLLGSKKVRMLLQKFGSAAAAIDAGGDAWQSLRGFGPAILSEWKGWYEAGKWKRNQELATKFGAKVIPFTSPDYPRSLLTIDDFPILLYVKGMIENKDEKAVAVVGTRNATIYGMEMAGSISQELTGLGFTVVSGLARGIDTAAHLAATRGGRTLAVIGSGLSDIYPRENRALAEKIIENGALISEFPMATPPDRQNFPQRNRIVSGLAMATLLIEAPLKSGAMITMERAHAQGRKLFVLPGRADSPNFKGNLSLIKNGRAALIENGKEIALLLGNADKLPHMEASPRHLPIALDSDESQLVKMLPCEEISLDHLAAKTKLPVMKLHVLLMSLLLKGVIKEYPGKIYKRLI